MGCIKCNIQTTGAELCDDCSGRLKKCTNCAAGDVPVAGWCDKCLGEKFGHCECGGSFGFTGECTRCG